MGYSAGAAEASYDWSGKTARRFYKESGAGCDACTRACARVLIIGPATPRSAGPVPPPLCWHHNGTPKHKEICLCIETLKEYCLKDFVQ